MTDLNNKIFRISNSSWVLIQHDRCIKTVRLTATNCKIENHFNYYNSIPLYANTINFKTIFNYQFQNADLECCIMERRKVAKLYKEWVKQPRDTGDYSEFVLDFRMIRQINQNVSHIKSIIQMSKNARFLILDHTKLNIENFWSILEAWRQNDKLSYLSAIENNQNQDEKVQELKEWEDQIWAILKKNVNIFSLALIDDEDKQNQSLHKITAELNK